MVYPTLAAIGDVAHPLWRARAVDVYRLWRDSGYAFGAIVGGITADFWGLRARHLGRAAITGLSGLAVAVRMYETHPRRDRPETFGKCARTVDCYVPFVHIRY